MKTSNDPLKKTYEALRANTDFSPSIGIVLGSGLGNLFGNFSLYKEINYGDICGSAIGAAGEYAGRLLLGYIDKTPVVILQGRIHYYEGYSMEEAVMPVRIMGMLGAKTIILTNAAGGINPEFKEGDIMLIEDHISLFVPNCLRGENKSCLGNRFPDMTVVYDRALLSKINEIAIDKNISLKTGIYVQLSGPSFETPAEIRLLSRLGADAVGMSTVCEAIASRHMGIKVLGLSCISNMASGISKYEQKYEDMDSVVKSMAAKLENLLSCLIEKIGNVRE